MVDGRAESPSETRVRLVLSDGGLPPDDLQIIVRHPDGYPLARLDMGYKRRGRQVGIEVDSAEHARPRAVYRDRYKLNDLHGEGWDVRQVTNYDAHRRPRYVVYQAENALGLR